MKPALAALVIIAAALYPAVANADSIGLAAKSITPAETGSAGGTSAAIPPPWTPRYQPDASPNFATRPTFSPAAARLFTSPGSSLLSNALLTRPFYTAPDTSAFRPRPAAYVENLSPKLAMMAMVIDSPEPGALVLLLAGVLATRMSSAAGRRPTQARG